MKTIREDALANHVPPRIHRMIFGIFISPGFGAVFGYRLTSRLRRGGALSNFLSKILYRILVSLNNCELSRFADIAPGLFVPHPVGIVVGRARIGRGVTLYQGVTIGQSGPDSGAPSLGDGVVVYAGAVLVGDITVGDGAVIGANSVVLSDIPPGAVAVGAPARVVRNAGVAGAS